MVIRKSLHTWGEEGRIYTTAEPGQHSLSFHLTSEIMVNKNILCMIQELNDSVVLDRDPKYNYLKTNAGVTKVRPLPKSSKARISCVKMTVKLFQKMDHNK